MVIKSQKDWWDLLEIRWLEIRGILKSFLPTAVAGEDVAMAKEQRDGRKLLEYMNDVWNEAPDSFRIHQIPGWEDFCDLCSESWVFDESEEQDEPGECQQDVCREVTDLEDRVTDLEDKVSDLEEKARLSDLPPGVRHMVSK